MDDDRDLRNFSGLCRLFPLPNVVLFPHAVLPLHIFEPRYRQMTADALADDRLVTVVQVRPSKAGSAAPPSDPPVEEVACLGKILQHEQLSDGRYNFLLLGLKRVRLRREVTADKLYRLAQAELLEDVEDGLPEEPRRVELAALFRTAFERQHEIDPDIATVLESPLPLGVLTDIVAHALGLPAAMKQRLLAETHVGRRSESLLALLREMIARPADTPAGGLVFPPPFSAN